MKIYVTHSSTFDYKTDLYQPLRQSDLHMQHEIILPHENSDAMFSSKEFISQCDLILAEVSEASTGQGIELGWADVYKLPIVCLYKKGTTPSAGLKVISTIFLEYDSPTTMVQKLTDYLVTKV